jgi:hypothetical protein
MAMLGSKFIANRTGSTIDVPTSTNGCPYSVDDGNGWPSRHGGAPASFQRDPVHASDVAGSLERRRTISIHRGKPNRCEVYLAHHCGRVCRLFWDLRKPYPGATKVTSTKTLAAEFLQADSPENIEKVIPATTDGKRHCKRSNWADAVSASKRCYRAVVFR